MRIALANPSIASILLSVLLKVLATYSRRPEQISATREAAEGKVSEELVGKRQFRVLGFSEDIKLIPSVVRGGIQH